MNKYLRFATVLVIIGISIVLLRWIGIVQTLSVSGSFSREPSLAQKFEACTQRYIGQSMWFLDEKEIVKSILNCDQIVKEVTVRYHFPRRVSVEIMLRNPLVKVEKEGGCTLIEDAANLFDASSERCSLYNLPILTAQSSSLHSYVYEYATTLVRLLQQNGLEVSSIEYVGEQVAPWYQVKLVDKGKIFFPSTTEIEQKVTTLVAALKGLNNAQERYSAIDLRFDRVVYK